MKHPSSFLPGGTQGEGSFYLTFRKHVMDGINPTFLCSPALLGQLKPPLTLELEHFTLGAKSNSLGGIDVFAFLSLCPAPS